MKTVNLVRFSMLSAALLLVGCGDDGGDGNPADMGVLDGEAEPDAGVDAGIPEQPVFTDLSAAVQVDRMGKPALNTAAIPTGECGVAGESCKTTYNKSESPADDLANFAMAAVAQLSGPDAATNASALWAGGLLTDVEAVTVAAAVWGDGGGTLFFGDMLVIDTSMPNGYSVVGGGRDQNDDVIDTTLDAITANSMAAGNVPGVASDDVDANDQTFPAAFPYFVAPN